MCRPHDRRRPPAALLALLLGSAALLAGCAPASFLVTPVAPQRTLDEEVIERESFFASRKIALVDVDGLISNQRSQPLLGGFSENPVALFVEKLRRVEQDDAVAAIVVRINSPGGTASPRPI
jgi:protease-4